LRTIDGSSSPLAVGTNVFMSTATRWPTVGCGCEATDFAGFPAGAVALLQRGGCDFEVKFANAEASGAAAVVVMNEGDSPDRVGLVPAAVGDATIPVNVVTFAAGNELRAGQLNGLTGFMVRVKVWDGAS
jgi:hypothetical protein